LGDVLRSAIRPTGIQDFAGSTAVHLIGATGALAALLLLGPRKGKYGRQAAQAAAAWA
jgi:Amt family ammonium transporter